MRSARIAIATAALVLVLVPLVAVVIAWLYEQLLTARFERALSEVAADALQTSDLQALASREQVELFLLDEQGRIVAQSFTRGLAARPSSLASAASDLAALFGTRAASIPWARVDAEAGPIGERAETKQALGARGTGGGGAFAARESSSGEVVLYSYALGADDGRGVYVQAATVRGLRRLVGLRTELLRLALYQLGAAVVFALLLGRWLVKPLERLADGAAAYRAGSPLAEADLLRRGDEVGTLARALDELTRSLEARRQETVSLAADMAHELKNPLATIAASAELIGSTKDPSPEKRALVEGQITGAVERLRAATDELLSLARLEASLPGQARERVDLLAVIEQVVAEYMADPRYSKIAFVIDAPPEARDARIIASAWKRMLRNLLDNAVVQPMAKPRVELALRRAAQDGFELVVRDFGPGVSEGNREKIFRRFFTQRPETSAPGTGLGLSIVRAVARAHDGEVELLPAAAAAAPGPGGGVGAAFKVTFRG